jgi:hypothetical protein
MVVMMMMMTTMRINSVERKRLAINMAIILYDKSNIQYNDSHLEVKIRLLKISQPLL